MWQRWRLPQPTTASNPRAESIAFYAGEVQEAHSASLRLDSLVAYVRRRVAWMAGLSLWSNFYSYATMLIPPLLTAPRYFAGEVEFGVITQVPTL